MFEKLCKLIAEQFGVDPETVTADSAFVDDLGADSVDLMDLSMALEEGVVNKNSSFHCSGSKTVDGRVIRCSKKGGHGLQNLQEAVAHSCNTASLPGQGDEVGFLVTRINEEREVAEGIITRIIKRG